MAWDDLKILGKILELWLEGMDGFAGHPVPNDSKDYQPNHRKSFEEVHWGIGDGLFVSDSTAPEVLTDGRAFYPKAKQLLNEPDHSYRLNSQ